MCFQNAYSRYLPADVASKSSRCRCRTLATSCPVRNTAQLWIARAKPRASSVRDVRLLRAIIFYARKPLIRFGCVEICRELAKGRSFNLRFWLLMRRLSMSSSSRHLEDSLSYFLLRCNDSLRLRIFDELAKAAWKQHAARCQWLLYSQPAFERFSIDADLSCLCDSLGAHGAFTSRRAGEGICSVTKL